jgi:hypothetical protein
MLLQNAFKVEVQEATSLLPGFGVSPKLLFTLAAAGDELSIEVRLQDL